MAIRNYQILLQRLGGLRAGRAGCSGVLPTERAAFPEAVFIFWTLSAPLLAVGYFTRYWWVAIPGAAVVVFTLVYLIRPSCKTGGYSDADVRYTKTGGAGGRQKRTFDRIRQRDAGFDGQRFLERVAHAFSTTQAAWSERRLEPIRPFVSDGVFERFRIALAEQDELGVRTRLVDPRIVQRFVIHGYAEQAFDVNTVRIDVLGDAEQLDGTGNPRGLPLLTAKYTEYWSWVRRASARTQQGKPGLLEGNCPSCGAPIAVNQSARCEFCRVYLRNGEHDWVLVEITQSGRWRSVDPDSVPGVLQLQQRDPNFSLACLEDLAAVVYWRLAEAARHGSAGMLGSGLSKELVGLYSERLRMGTTPPELPRSRQVAVPPDEYWYVGQRSIEAIDAVGVRIADGHQAALMRVRYSGRIMARRASQRATPRDELHGQTLLLLARNESATTELNDGLSGAHCHQCGAPQSDAVACRYCGARASAGPNDWRLVATSHVSPPGYDLFALERELRTGSSGSPR